MFKVLVARMGRLIATLFVVTFLSFIMTSLLPGDPATAILGQEGIQNAELLEKVRNDLGLNDPIPVRYVRWLGDAVQGDLGESYTNRGQEVSDVIADRVPVTAQLASMAILFAVILSVPIGILGAYKQGRWPDKVSSAGVQVALSVPNFIVGIFLIWLISVKLDLLPASNWNRISNKGLWANLQTAIMPAMALCLSSMAAFSRLVRSDMISTLREDYVLAARAKGLGNGFILGRHALRPSSLSLATLLGVNFGALLGGTVVIEFLFAIPGLGQRLINAIYQRDIMVIQGITVFIAVVYVVVNTIVDLFYSVIDPRIRKG